MTSAVGVAREHVVVALVVRWPRKPELTGLDSRTLPHFRATPAQVVDLFNVFGYSPDEKID